MNTKMKVLSLALVGLAGFAGSAMAACPAGPTTAEGGAWTAKSNLGGAVAISTTGLDGSECKLDTSITTNGPGVNAFVRDDSPENEARYRAQFLVNADALGAQSSIQGAQVFGASTSAPANSVAIVARLAITGNLQSTGRILNITTACAGQPGNICSATTPLAAGVNTIEIDWKKGSAAGTADGYLKVWVNNNNEAQPTVNLPSDSAVWGGVDFAGLGLSTVSPDFRAQHLNQIVNFDKFDSRRQTFIGF